MWPDVILKGVSYKFGTMYCTESLQCVRSMLENCDPDILRQFVLSGSRLTMLLTSLIDCLTPCMNEKTVVSCFEVIEIVLTKGGEVVTSEFEKCKGLDVLENL